MKKILITGCCGFIGFHLTKRLLSESYEVVGIDNINSYYDINLKNSRLNQLLEFTNFKFVKIDISSNSILTIFNEKFEVIINLAAQAGVRHSIIDPFSYTMSNLVGFANILELSRKMNSRLIFASTSSVYGANKKQPFKEDEIADHPIQYYAATKRSNELMAHSYSSMYEMSSIGLRFFTVYGPWGRPDMALFKFTENIIRDKPIDVFNNGNHVRDFTFVDDIVDGICRCINYKITIDNLDNGALPRPDRSSSSFRIFNLGNSKPINLMEYIKVIEDLLGKRAKINFHPLQPGDVVSTESNIDNAKLELGYSPKTDIKTGVRKFIEWYKDYYGC